MDGKATARFPNDANSSLGSPAQTLHEGVGGREVNVRQRVSPTGAFGVCPFWKLQEMDLT